MALFIFCSFSLFAEAVLVSCTTGELSVAVLTLCISI